MSPTSHLHLDPMLVKVGSDGFARGEVLAGEVKVLLK